MDELKNIVEYALRRATIFMGISENAAQIDPPLSYTLDDRVSFHVVPPNLDDATKRRLTEDFKLWVISNALRDVSESFDLFLQNLYSAVIVLTGDHDHVTWRAARKDFSSKGGLNRHMELVCKLMNIDNRFREMFLSLNIARNCLAHRSGIVGDEDTKFQNGILRLTWVTMAAHLPNNGIDVSLQLQMGQPVHVTKSEPIEIRDTIRSKEFAKNSKILLNRHELSEICFGFLIARDFSIHHLVELAKIRGAIRLT